MVLVADGEAVAEESAATASESQSQESADEPTDPKDIQRKKSWEGRLRKLEAELKAKADAIAAGKPEMNGPADDGSTVDGQASEALEQVADQAEAQGDMAMADKVEETAEKVESGEMSTEDAMKALAEDFGEPFVKMIAAIAKSAASATAGEKIGELEKSTADIIDHLKDRNAREHFKAIESAHADFVEIGQDPAFGEWKAQDPERERIAAGGTADEIISMLSEFKGQGTTTDTGGADAAPAPVAEFDAQAEQAADDSAPDDELDAAEGVRSAGMQLPEEPAAADDYAGAWEEFEAKDRKRT